MREMFTSFNHAAESSRWLGLNAYLYTTSQSRQGETHMVLYVARLIIVNPASPIILAPALLNGFLVNPAWYIWLGVALWRGRAE